MTNLVIAVCTYKRPVMLKTLLDSLSVSAFRKCPAVKASVLIVDNDASGSAKPAIDGLQDFPLPVRYVLEVAKGLASARNRALNEAAETDFLCFLDDDMTVDPECLDELLWMVLQKQAAFALGPVQPVFPPRAPRGLVECGMYQRHELEDGTPLTEAATGNSILRMAFIRTHAIRFHTAFEETGGEDTHFFDDIIKGGGQGYYARHARAWEPVTASRLNLMWLLRRRCRVGVTKIMRARLRGASIVFYIKQWLIALICICGAPFAALLLYPLRPGLSVRALCLGARGIGLIMAMMGHEVREYAPANISGQENSKD